ISNTGFPNEVFFPFTYSHAIHEIGQSYRDRVPVYNNIPDLEAQAFLSTIRVEINHPHLLAHEQFLDEDRKSTRLNSSHVSISYAVFCLKKKKINIDYYNEN